MDDSLASLADTNPYQSEQFKKVTNLLEFHIRDTMKLDSTYLATLAMVKEPGGKIMLKDTTQEISLRMNATLE